MAVVLLGAACEPAQAQNGPAPSLRALQADDLARFRDVREPQVSPEGDWVAYTVSTVDPDRDRWSTDLWMTRWSGEPTVRLTYTGDIDGTPRWSPDGHWLAFLASREGDDDPRQGSQVWLLDRMGGEAHALTEAGGGVTDLAWSPDGQRLLLVVTDTDPADEPESLPGWLHKTKPPIVIDRYHFKQDRSGYLGAQQTHLSLLDLPSGQLRALTSGPYSEVAPAWSPDGRRIAFYSNRASDPDRTEAIGLYVMDARPDAPAQALAQFVTDDGEHPAWSPDGRWIAFLQGDAVRYSAYHRFKLMAVPAQGGALRALTPALDRSLQGPLLWSRDSARLSFVVEDDRTAYVATATLDGAPIRRLTEGAGVVSALAGNTPGRLAMLVSSATAPPEVQVLDAGPRTSQRTRRITHQNDAWLAEVRLGQTEGFTSTSTDGTEVHGLVTRPNPFRAGQRYPTILLVHGGPNGQDAYEMDAYDDFLRELLADHGYAVLQVNYRGSSGRGDAYQKAIFADWGHLEVQDLLGAVDWAVAQGLADPQRLGVAGWSYGGMLTDYLIASDTRFKAAVSGAGTGNPLALYGSDQYVVQYEQELGPPWVHLPLWLQVSYPFLHADRIKTPTLFLSGEHDFNVPTAGSEQMYQALRSLGVDTQLVIYPGQYHSLTTPSYEQDAQARYLAWFDRHLQPAAGH
jgi:dipeptidyl aminopeptidase/acylaminoacyl peptidase